ncbi:MAG: hypothetical protein N2645_22245 [Clostridia bacterium]|nr:hypothetical protein [Clostridia bacterium]
MLRRSYFHRGNSEEVWTEMLNRAKNVPYAGCSVSKVDFVK